MWTHARRPTVGILIFDDVETLDFIGPYEVFVGCGLFDVFTVAAQRDVRCQGGLQVTAAYDLASAPPMDFFIVPGGPGAREQRAETQQPLIDFIRGRHEAQEPTASVCTGAFLLGRAGILDGREATTHSLRHELFSAEFPAVQLVAAKIVDTGSVVTAGGVSSGIDLALYMLEREFGADERRKEAARLDGPWI